MMSPITLDELRDRHSARLKYMAKLLTHLRDNDPSGLKTYFDKQWEVFYGSFRPILQGVVKEYLELDHSDAEKADMLRGTLVELMEQFHLRSTPTIEILRAIATDDPLDVQNQQTIESCMDVVDPVRFSVIMTATNLHYADANRATTVDPAKFNGMRLAEIDQFLDNIHTNAAEASGVDIMFM